MDSETVHQTPQERLDSEVAEEWVRETAEPDVRNVAASKWAGGGAWPWRVEVWAAEFVRIEPLESLLRRRLREELIAVEGVHDVADEDREVWIVSGHPLGSDLVLAAARVVDALASEIRSEISRER